MKKIILDVDTGIDDAIAILYAMKSKQLDILGITTVCGNTSCDQATINTKKVLSLIEYGQTIPVIKGAKNPLMRKPHYEVDVHGSDGIGGALTDVDVNEQSNNQFAPDFFIEQAIKYPKEVTFILVGPLTNMALAIRKEPRIVDLVKEVIFMGGSVRAGGNVTPTAEFNIFADPEAAKIVLHAGLPITMVGLDVTLKAVLSGKEIKQLEGSTIGDFVKSSTKIYMNRYFETSGVRACAMHDPLAVGVAIDKSFVKTKNYYVDVETDSELSDGQTICDFNNKFGKNPNVKVCMEVDGELFIKTLIGTLKD